jgi:hypothetical protein
MLEPTIIRLQTLELSVLHYYVVFQDQKSIIVGIHSHSLTLGYAFLIKQSDRTTDPQSS